MCLLIYHKKVAILASKLATLSAEFDHANKLGAKMWTSIIENFYFDVAQSITKEKKVMNELPSTRAQGKRHNICELANKEV